jgi:hypothetical protein
LHLNLLYAHLAVPDPLRDNPTYSTLGTVFKNLEYARTLQQIRNALLSIPPVLEANYAKLQTTRPEFQLVMHEGAKGNVITKSELLIAKAAAEMKVPKKVTESRIRILQH